MSAGSDDLVEISPRVFQKSLLKQKLEADEDSDRPRKRIRVSDELNDGNHMRPRPANSHVSEYSPPAKPKACPSPPLKRKLEEVLDSDRPRKRMKRAAPPAYSVSDGNHVRPQPANSNLGRRSEHNQPSKRKACPSPPFERKLEVDSDSDRPRKRTKLSDESDDGKNMRPRPANSILDILSYVPPSKRKGRLSPMVVSATEGLPLLRKRAR